MNNHEIMASEQIQESDFKVNSVGKKDTFNFNPHEAIQKHYQINKEKALDVIAKNSLRQNIRKEDKQTCVNIYLSSGAYHIIIPLQSWQQRSSAARQV